MRMNSRLFVGLLACAWWAYSLPAQAQFQVPQGSLAFEDTGTLEAVQDQLISIHDSKNERWVLSVTSDTLIKIDGEAEKDFLRAGLPVQFTGEVDKKGILQSPIEEIEICSPHGKASMGMFTIEKDGA